MKPKLSWRDEDSGAEVKQTRAERIEATGSVSPDKKKRRQKPSEGEGFQVVRMQPIDEESPAPVMAKLQLNLATAEKPRVDELDQQIAAARGQGDPSSWFVEQQATKGLRWIKAVIYGGRCLHHRHLRPLLEVADSLGTQLRAFLDRWCLKRTQLAADEIKLWV